MTDRMQVEALNGANGEVRANFAAAAAEMPDIEQRPGVNRLPPRLIVRKAKTKGKGPILYIRDGQREISTRLPPSRRADAETLLALYTHKKEAKERGIVGSRHIPVNEVLDDWVAATRPPRSAPRGKQADYAATVSRARTLQVFFAGKTLKDVCKASCVDYVDWRTSQPDARFRPGTPGVPFASEASAREDLLALKKAIELCVDERKLAWAPKVFVPPNGQPRTRWLRRNEVARILWTLRGRVWDREANAWKTETYLDADGVERTRRFLHPPEVVASRAHMVRFVLFGLWTGTRNEALRELQWVVSAEGGCVDVDNRLIHRRGFGRDPRQGKPRASSRMARKLASMARHMRDRDLAAGITHVFHQADGRPYGSSPVWLWRTVMADAGIGRDVTPHTLRHTAATWMRIGQIDVRLCADVLGMSIQAAVRIYGQWTMEGQQDAADMLAWGAGVKALAYFGVEDAIAATRARSIRNAEMATEPEPVPAREHPMLAQRRIRGHVARHGASQRARVGREPLAVPNPRTTRRGPGGAA